MKHYSGERLNGRTRVRVFGDDDSGPDLDPRFDLYNHSPTGFEWGYHGSGPAQLALAIAVDHLGDDVEALRLHQVLKTNLVAKLQTDTWTLSSDEIEEALPEAS